MLANTRIFSLHGRESTANSCWKFKFTLNNFKSHAYKDALNEHTHTHTGHLLVTIRHHQQFSSCLPIARPPFFKTNSLCSNLPSGVIERKERKKNFLATKFTHITVAVWRQSANQMHNQTLVQTNRTNERGHNSLAYVHTQEKERIAVYMVEQGQLVFKRRGEEKGGDVERRFLLLLTFLYMCVYEFFWLPLKKAKNCSTLERNEEQIWWCV